MATGRNRWTSGIVLIVLFAVPAAILTIDTAATAQDGEAATLLKKGIQQLRAGDQDNGKKALRAAIAAGLTSRDVIDSLDRAGYAALYGLMSTGQEGANLTKAILHLATPETPENAFDPAEIRRLSESAVTADDYTKRFDAAMALAASYGEFAVPTLVQYLSSNNTEHKINAHITLMNRIGRAAVLPLNEALASGSAAVRRYVATELGAIGDERSLAALAEAAESEEDEDARIKAKDAFDKLATRYSDAPGASASDLYFKLASYYYGGQYRVMSFSDKPLVLWRWRKSETRGGGALIGQPVPRHLYVLKLAEEACYDSLRLNPENAAAASLLVRILASEKIAAEAAAGQATDETAAAYAAGLADVSGTIAGMGWKTMSRALTAALDWHDQGAAVVILDAMPLAYGHDDFTADNPVVRATADRSSAVRLAAAEAVLRFNGIRPIKAFSNPDDFVALVANSAGAIVPRHILVIDGNDERRNLMLNALNDAKFIAYEARNGSDGIVRALRAKGLDLILLSSDLIDMEALEVLARFGQDDRTRNVPVVVVGSSEEAGDAQWRDLYKSKSKGVVGMPSGEGAATQEFLTIVNDAFGSEGAGTRAGYERSASILDALATTDTAADLFHWSALAERLNEVVASDTAPNDPPVRANALRAIANIGDRGSLEGLLAFFKKSSDAGLRAEAARSVAAICRRNEVTFDAEQFKSLLTGTHDADTGVRHASFAALGSSALTAEQALSVAVSNRPGTRQPASE